MTPPRKINLAPRPAPARWGLLLLLGGGIALSLGARQDQEVLVAPPMIVSTASDGPTWKTIPELKAAAATGNALACFQYAQLLEVGDQVAQDTNEAFKFYQKAAFSDHADSLFRVAKAYHEGQLSQPENHQLAFEYYERAAYLNHPEATYNVGAMLVSGRGVKRDYREGLAWLMLAAELGADPGAVDQVKQRLIQGKRPEWIADAVNRLGGLKTEIAMGPVDEDADLAPPVAKPATPVIAPAPSLKPSIGVPSMPSFDPQLSTPAITPPTIAIPPPTPKPIGPKTPEAE